MTIRKLLSAMALIGLLLGAAPAAATPITVSFSSTSVAPMAYAADTFSESGLSGLLSLDSSLLTTNTVNIATLVAGDSGGFNNSTPITLTFSLTLGGVTHALSQSGTWAVTPTQDSIVTFASSGSVLFATASGDWAVSLNGFAINATSLGSHSSSVTADFQPIPEPTSLVLLGIGLLAVAARAGKRLT